MFISLIIFRLVLLLDAITYGDMGSTCDVSKVNKINSKHPCLILHMERRAQHTKIN